MIAQNVKKEEPLITEEEPIPEEYKENRITNQSNVSQNLKENILDLKF